MKVWRGEIHDYLGDLDSIKAAHDCFVVFGLTERKIVFKKKLLKDGVFQGEEVKQVLVWDEELL